jgi:phage tail sheath protein FI
MPIAPTYPGVYIEELPSGVRTITGVSTSVTAFLGTFTRGKLNQPTQIFSIADLERAFGPLVTTSEAGYAIRQFFLNGGKEAWVVRVASGAPAAAAIAILDALGGTNALQVDAASEGVWGNGVQIDVNHDTAMAGQFNLTAREVDATGRTVASETYRNLSLVPGAANFAEDVVNSSSSLIRVKNLAAAPNARVAETGTMTSTALTDAGANGLAATKTLQVVVGGNNVGTALQLGSSGHETASRLASLLEAKLQATDASLRSVRVTAEPVLPTPNPPAKNLRITGLPAGSDQITFTGTLAADIKLDAVNVQAYTLGGTAAGAQVLPQGGQKAGNDGGPADGAALLGDPVARSGLYALEQVDIFNILSVPDTMNLADNEASGFIPQAEAYCEKRRAFFVLDVPQKAAIRDTVQEIKDWLDANGTFRHKNAALYFPRPAIPDPVNGFRDRIVPPSGTIAGLYARTDAERGVWKAPAGTEAVLRGVRALETVLTDDQNGTLNPLAINNLRTFRVYGTVCWGARTLDGADQQASEWKYIPIRRTALFIEESLFRGTKWAVFEPNGESLWAQLRLNVGGFMQDLFRQGAFAGTTPRDAYFVKCDGETTTQNDQNLGVVNILVGFAPLKPAEFVIIQIQQIAGKIET